MAVKSRDRLMPVTASLFLATLFLYLLAAFLPTSRIWGVNWWSHYPLWSPFCLLVLGLLLLALIWKYSYRLEQTGDFSDRTRLILTILIFAGLVASFILLRTRVHLLGDGYTILSILSTDNPFIKPRNIGGMMLPYWLSSWLGDRSEAGVLTAYRIVSISAGAGFLIAVALSARALFERNVDRLLFLLGMSSGGYMLLFFGYVENYAVFVLSVTVFCLVGLLAACDRISRWWVVPLSGAVVFHHALGVVLLPATFYLVLVGTRFGKGLGRLRSGNKWILTALVIALAAVVFGYYYATDYFVRFAVVPLVADSFTVEGYTLLSLSHLIDFFNLLVLLFPGLLVVVGVGMSLPLRTMLRKIEYRFLLLSLVSCLGAAFLFDPKLGMPRDWDLFAFAGVPLALMSCYMILNHGDRLKQTAFIMVLVIGLGLLLLFPRAVSLTSPEIASAHFRTYYALDSVKNRAGRFVFSNWLRESGDTLTADLEQQLWLKDYPEEQLFARALTLSQRKEYAEAIPLYERGLKLNPVNANGWANLGACLNGVQMYDSALAILSIADGLNPYSVAAYHNMACSYVYKGDLKQAESLWLKARKYDDTAIEPLIGLTRLYARMNDRRKYLEYRTLTLLHQGRRPDLAQQLAGDSVMLSGDKERVIAEPLFRDLSSREIAAAYCAQGNRYYRAGEYDSAEVCWLRSVDKDTSRLDVLLQLGNLYKKQDRQSEYVSNFMRIAGRDDAPLSFVQGMAQYYLQIGNYTKAAEVLQRALGMGLDSEYVRDLQQQHSELRAIP